MLEDILKPRRAIMWQHLKVSPRKLVKKSLPVTKKAVSTYIPRATKTSIADLKCTCCFLLRSNWKTLCILVHLISCALSYGMTKSACLKESSRSKPMKPLCKVRVLLFFILFFYFFFQTVYQISFIYVRIISSYCTED